MGLDVDVTVRDSEVRRNFRRLEKRAGDLKPMFRDFDRDVGDFFRRRFETAGRHGGSPWKPLSRKTRLARNRAGVSGNKGGVGKPLWATGKLKESLQEVGGDSIRHIGRHRYVRGTRVPYAVYHQEGMGVPRRELLPDEGGREVPRVLELKLLRQTLHHLQRLGE